MNTIYKYPLTLSSAVQIVSMPKDARVRHVAIQPGLPGRVCLWAQVDTDKPMVPRRFQKLGTGEPIPQPSLHCGTWLDGSYVWHLFELWDL